MKKIKYYLNVEGTAGPQCVLPYSEENMALAEAEAFGEVTVEDDGAPEPEETPSQEERLAALEAAMLEMILGGEA